MIWPAATDTNFSAGTSGLSAFSRFNRGTSLVKRRAEQCRPKTLVSGTPKVPVNRAAESATCKATCSRVFGTLGGPLIWEAHVAEQEALGVKVFAVRRSVFYRYETRGVVRNARMLPAHRNRRAVPAPPALPSPQSGANPKKMTCSCVDFPATVPAQRGIHRDKYTEQDARAAVVHRKGAVFHEIL